MGKVLCDTEALAARHERCQVLLLLEPDGDTGSLIVADPRMKPGQGTQPIGELIIVRTRDLRGRLYFEYKLFMENPAFREVREQSGISAGKLWQTAELIVPLCRLPAVDDSVSVTMLGVPLTIRAVTAQQRYLTLEMMPETPYAFDCECVIVRGPLWREGCIHPTRAALAKAPGAV